MATYKKRGFKNKASSNKAEALENKSTTANVFNTLDEGSSRTQQWVEKNQNKILGVVGIVSVCLLYTSPSPRDRNVSRMPSSA